MAKPSALSALGFDFLDEKVNRNILIYNPATSFSASSSLAVAAAAAEQPRRKSPRVIVLCTWLGGATPSRIAIYARGYQQLYPSSAILLIRTTLTDFTTKTYARTLRDLKPAREYLLKTCSEPQEGDGALFHVFSNGGGFSAVFLDAALREGESNGDMPIPVTGLILDSCPGSISFQRTYSAAVYSLPQTGLRGSLGRALMYPYVGAHMGLQYLGVASSLEDLRRALYRFAPAAARLYLHSKEDGVVTERDVKTHAERQEVIANGRGKVQREMWQIGGHCALAREDPERYWSVVEGFVERALGDDDEQRVPRAKL